MSTVMIAQCYPDRHNTSSTSAWLSCVESPNPNALRGDSHWVKYDFDYTYELSQMTLWNYNESDFTNRGAQDIVIDYSLDGVEWIEWGTYKLEQSAGSSIYEGEKGPDLGGLFAKHILITAVSNYGGSCFGLSEVKIDVESFISGTDEPLVDVDLSLSPIPADQQFTIDLTVVGVMENVVYTIIDLKGTLISRKLIEVNDSKLQQTIYVSDLPSGQYILALQSDLFNTSQMITVLHP